MDPFFELISNDVQRHKLSEDGKQWPAGILKHVQKLQNEVNLPAWVKAVRCVSSKANLMKLNSQHTQGPYPFLDPVDVPFLNELATSAFDLWDHSGQEGQGDINMDLWTVFRTVISDCNAIRRVLVLESIDETPYPKEAYLVPLVHNIFLEARRNIVSL